MKPSTFLLIFLFIISIWLAVISTTYKAQSYPGGPDEYWYFNYASTLNQSGISAFSTFFKEYCANSFSWVYPNPFRIGYFTLSSLWLKLTGFKYINLAYLSLLFYLFTVVISYIFSRRYLGEKTALLSASLLAFSPLGMALSRRAILDTTNNFFIVLCLLAFFVYTRNNKNRYLFAFTVALAISILVKETAAVFSLFFLFWIVYDEFISKRYFRSKIAYLRIAGLIISFAIVFLVYFSLGAVPYLFRLGNIIINSPLTNQFALDFGRGPWFRYLLDYLLLSPVVFILALFYIGTYLFSSRDKNDFVNYSLVCCLFTILLFNLFTKNVRYVFLVDYFFRIFAVLMVQDIFPRSWRLKGLLVAALIVLLCLYDLNIFSRLFLSQCIYDPVSYSMLKAWNFIP